MIFKYSKSFVDIRAEGGFFVDNTKYIPQILGQFQANTHLMFVRNPRMYVYFFPYFILIYFLFGK